MPTVMLFLDNETDTKINILKAQLGIKSKRELIDCAINQYLQDKLKGDSI